MMRKIKLLWDCCEPAERVCAIAYAACVLISAWFVVKTLSEWVL